MKKVLLTLLMLYSASLFAQDVSADYNAFKNNGSTQPLAAVDIFDSLWDDTSATFALGFEFPFNGQFVDSITISSNGYVDLNKGAGRLWLFGIDFTDGRNEGSGLKPSAIQFERDSIGEDTHKHYKSRLVMIHYVSVRFKGAGDSNYVNTSMIIYEDKTIEYYYGSSKVNSNQYLASGLDTFPMSAVCYQITPGVYNCLVSKGSVSNPGWDDQPGVTVPQPTSPPWSPTGGLSGNRYTFEPWNLSVNEFTASALKVYPNPATNYVNLTTDLAGKTYQVTIYDIVGKKVFTETSNSKEYTVDLASFTKGFYTIKITTENGQASRKLVVE